MESQQGKPISSEKCVMQELNELYFSCYKISMDNLELVGNLDLDSV